MRHWLYELGIGIPMMNLAFVFLILPMVMECIRGQ